MSSAWRLSLILALAAALLVLLAGDPLEGLEHRWFDTGLRLRTRWGSAPPVDPRIVHLDLTDEDLGTARTLRDEYRLYADVVSRLTAAGADILVLDLILSRGDEQTAAPVVAALKQSGRVVLGVQPGTGLTNRSFPFLAADTFPSGAVNVTQDADGVFRHYPLVSHGVPSLALQAYLLLQGISGFTPGSASLNWTELSTDGTTAVQRSVPANPLLDFRAPWSASPATSSAAFRHLTLADLRGGAKLPGAIVLIGYVGADMDEGPTSLDPQAPRVILHSTALNGLLQGTFHRRTSRPVDALLLLSVLLLGWASDVGSRRHRHGLIVGAMWASGVFTMAAASLWMVFKTAYLIDAVAVVSIWTLAFLLELIRHAQAQSIERARLDTALSYYFSPRVAAEVRKDPTGLVVAQNADLVLMLNDVRNFTPLSELMGARGIFNLLNEVFEILTNAALDQDASLEHFVGDQFLAYWGAPGEQPDAADRALKAAFEVLQRLHEFEKTLAPDVGRLFGCGVGLHAGPCVVGNKGSKRRLDYGILGDTVNLAARVESLTKVYHLPMLMTRDLYERLRDKPPSRLLDRVVVVGKRDPVDVMDVQHPLSPPDYPALALAYNTAFEAYRTGQFAAAEPQFRHLAAHYKDGASLLLADRCLDFAAHPPPDWTGIYEFTSK